MQILLANAKIMFGKTDRKPLSTPLFQTTADMLAAEMAKMDMEDLARQLNCSKKIATENWIRYQNFVVAEKMPALLAYNGQAYKHLRAATLSEEALEYAQKHLWITCFLYGYSVPWMPSYPIVWNITSLSKPQTINPSTIFGETN